MRKYLALAVSLTLLVVLALPVLAQDTGDSTTDTDTDTTSQPAVQPTAQVTAEADAELQTSPQAQTDTSMQPSLTGTQAAPQQFEGPSLTSYLTENFVRVGEGIQVAGLADTLSSGQFTIFVPNDGAFITLTNDIERSLNDLFGNPVLMERLLTYHVVPGRITSDQILNNGAGVLESVNGAALTFGYNNVTSRITINNGAASIEQPDIVLGNGIVHVIDNVLISPDVNEMLTNPDAFAPVEEATPVRSISEISQNNFVVLTEAVQAAGLQDELASGQYTLFAPNDGAFTTLLNELDMSYEEFLSNPQLLEQVLSYHMVPSVVTAEDIQDGVSSLTTVNGANLSFGFDNTVSRMTINGGEASIEAPNLFASNGVVHVIDNVLLPPQIQ